MDVTLTINAPGALASASTESYPQAVTEVYRRWQDHGAYQSYPRGLGGLARWAGSLDVLHRGAADSGAAHRTACPLRRLDDRYPDWHQHADREHWPADRHRDGQGCGRLDGAEPGRRPRDRHRLVSRRRRHDDPVEHG